MQSISDVHAILYKTGSSETVQFDAYLGELCRRLGTAASKRGVDIQLEAQPLEVASEDAVQMGIIVNDGLRLPMTRVGALQFAKATPYETHLEYQPARGERAVIQPSKESG